MPLYCDELVSKETAGFIELHLGQCNDCREKYKNSCEEVPVTKADIVPVEEDDKFRSAKKFLLKIRKRMFLSGIFALIIIFIASTGSYYYGKRFNNEVPIKVDSAEDFANRVVPGWLRAQKSGQIVDLDISKPISGTAAVVTFEKVWYTPSYTYVLYTVKEPNKKYLMASGKDIDIPPDKNMRNNQSMEPLGQRWGGISSEGFHQVMVFSGYNTPVPSKELTLTASGWIAPRNSSEPGAVDVIDGEISVKLPLSDEFLIEKSETIKLNKNYEWEGRSLHITGLEVGSSKTLLYGEVKLLQGETLRHIHGVIKCGEQSTGLSYESVVPGDTPDSFKFVFYGNPLSEWPGEISLDIKSIEFKTAGTFALTVDWSLYADKKDKIHVPLKQGETVSFYDSTVRLMTVIPDKWVNLEIVEPSRKTDANKPYVTMSTNLSVDLSNNNSSGLKVANENGDILGINGTAGGNIEGPDKIGIGFGIDAEDALWKTSKKINITINKPYAQLVVNQKIELN